MCSGNSSSSHQSKHEIRSIHSKVRHRIMDECIEMVGGFNQCRVFPCSNMHPNLSQCQSKFPLLTQWLLMIQIVIQPLNMSHHSYQIGWVDEFNYTFNKNKNYI